MDTPTPLRAERPLRVLVACEFSGIVREAFRRLGHDAMSCDLLPTEIPGPHYWGDVRHILDEEWDLMIAHPPCTYLCASGLHWNRRGAMVDGRPREELTGEALEFVRLLLDAPIPRIALENPRGCIPTRLGRKSTQMIQPHEFGEDASKETFLWLKGLPKLVPTERVRGRMVRDPRTGKTVERWANQTDSGQNNLPPSEERWMHRSRTYPGIAWAMAKQWGGVVAKNFPAVNPDALSPLSGTPPVALPPGILSTHE